MKSETKSTLPSKLNLLTKIICLILLVPFYYLIYKIYIPGMNAFGCFDDCFNIVPGYFIGQGKVLYQEIFFNHQLIMPYLSYLIQVIFKPQAIYELILRHRQFMFLTGYVFSSMLVIRFGIIGFIFAIYYELTKYYIFGERFLAEGIIVYPLVYVFGLGWLKLTGKTLKLIDYLTGTVFIWFVIFMREPFSIIALLLFANLLYGKLNVKFKIYSLILFLILTLGLFLYIPFHDFFFNVVTVNQLTVFADESKASNIFGSGIIQAFIYPFMIISPQGYWNLFRFILIGLTVTFFVSLIHYLYAVRIWKIGLYIFLVLGLANLRFGLPGITFYSAFHLIPWYGLYIFSTLLLIKDVTQEKLVFKILYSLGIFAILIFFIISPQSYLHEKKYPQEEFVTNYGSVMAVGEVIKVLSKPTDTLFLDGADDLIYWQSGLNSDYPYSWYTSVMPHIKKYANARTIMFGKNPPTFYYRFCSKNPVPYMFLPDTIQIDYQVINADGKPSCLYVRKDKIPEIKVSQWEKAKTFLYELPVNSY
jgi:hypothetical protein